MIHSNEPFKLMQLIKHTKSKAVAKTSSQVRIVKTKLISVFRNLSE